jgi:hypothetical protein
MRLLLLTIHMVLAFGLVLGMTRAPGILAAAAVAVLLAFLVTCTGLWLDRRWTAIPAGLVGLGAGVTSAGVIATYGGDVLRIVLALAALVTVEAATVVHSLRLRAGRSPV